MKQKTKNKLFELWAWCDEMDKSTEFMFQYMSDMSGLDYDEVVAFICNTEEAERSDWYKNNPDWYKKYPEINQT